MAITRLNIDDFLQQAKQHIVIDVRSPSEYNHAHIPDAYSLPLFNDEERKIVGTAYKQQSREAAIKIGLDYYGTKMRAMVEQAEAWLQGREDKTVLVHCWRGGMRSAGVAWLLDLYGFKVYTLAGGYKAFRNKMLEQFSQPYTFNIIGGYTGSGKTEVLHKMNGSIIDLEAIAGHRGSAFGAMDGVPQPSQEMFENKLALQLMAHAGNTIWLEDESQRVGHVNIPHALWKQMRQSMVCFLDVPFEERLQYIVAGYSKKDKEQLVNATMRIQKRLGPLETKTAINHLLEDNYTDSFAILLKYYDKQYKKGLQERSPDTIRTITSSNTNAATNAILVANSIRQNG
ncbi:tRNA 2-selenouridine(34) synthase MnmH [Chitinophagaceae bacterium IBVUCB1]|nr:tRNA 2-selenouridine(34) synthase MnmH [Chitinophagaceae bacterium IBVUCB1]